MWNKIVDFFKRIINEIKKILCDKKFWIFLIITLIFYGALYRLSFSRCTYRMYFYNWEEEFKHYLGSGRCITAICWALVSILNVSLTATYTLSYILAIFSITFAMYKLSFIIQKLINNEKMSYIISILIIINAYVVDYFMYLEKGIMAFSLLLAIIALGYLDKYFETNKKVNLLYAFIVLTILNFAYQASGGLFVSLALVLILKYSKNIKEFFKNNIITALLYGIPLVIDFLVLKLTYPTDRNSGVHNLIESTVRIIKSFDKLFISSFNTLPKYFFLVILLSIVVGFIVNIMLNKNNEKIKFQNLKISSKVLSVLGLVYIFIGCLFISIFPQYSLSTENINLTARCTYTFASIIGIIILYMYYTQSLTKLDNKIYISIAIIYLVIQFMQLQFIIQDLYKVNELDMITAKSVEQTIEEYEQTSGIEVKNVVYYKDKNSSNSYPNIINFGEINQKIITKRWRNLSVLGFFTGRDLQMQTSDEYENKEYEEYFSTKDWDYFDEEQLKFSGDTVYWCLF